MKPWTFVHVADIQPGSPKSYRFNPSWRMNWEQARQQILGIRPDLLLVGGDLTRDGSIHRFELDEMEADFASLPFPVHVIPGNMDTGNKHTGTKGLHRGPDQCTDFEMNVTSAQLRQFSAVFGDLWWTFDHKGTRFSGFADVVVNSGVPEETAFWGWAEKQMLRPKVKNQVWIMHYALFMDTLDEPDWDIGSHYLDWYFSIDQPGKGRLTALFQATSADIVISSHIHCRKVSYQKGIRFEKGPATSFGQWEERWPDGDVTLGFLKYTVSEAEIRSDFIPLEKVHNLAGYGPGGHPAPGYRDYSLSWVK